MRKSRPAARKPEGAASPRLRTIATPAEGNAARVAEVDDPSPRADRLGADDVASRATSPVALGDEERVIPDNAYRVDLPASGFEGPLDLLLHLIQKHELDILNIPIGTITEHYLRYLDLMQTLSIDVASEYLVMAATLAHIKSKMLLPVAPSGQDDALSEEEEDPRAELVRRLLDYQKYKAAAVELSERGTLGKDVFPRGTDEPVVEGVAPFAEVGVFSLFDAFEKLLKRAKIEVNHEVAFDRISITDRIVELTERLAQRRGMSFEDLFADTPQPTRFDVVITFLSLLEMAKLRLIRVYQSEALATIYLELASAPEGSTLPEPEVENESPEAPAAEAKEASEEPASEEALTEEAAIEEAVAEEAALEEVVAEEAAIEAVVAEEAAIEDFSVEEAVIEEAAVEEAVVEAPAIEDFSVEEAVVEAHAIEDFSVEEAVVEAHAIEDFSVEEAVVESAAIEEAAIEEALPSDEAAPLADAEIEAPSDDVVTSATDSEDEALEVEAVERSDDE